MEEMSHPVDAADNHPFVVMQENERMLELRVRTSWIDETVPIQDGLIYADNLVLADVTVRRTPDGESVFRYLVEMLAPLSDGSWEVTDAIDSFPHVYDSAVDAYDNARYAVTTLFPRLAYMNILEE